MSQDDYWIIKMVMRDCIKRILDEYNVIYENKDYVAREKFSKIVTKNLVEKVEAAINIKNEFYIIGGSTGKGRIAQIPWVSIRDKRVAPSAQEGVYVVYLFTPNGNVVLTLCQAIEDKNYKYHRENITNFLNNNSDQSKYDIKDFTINDVVPLKFGDNLSQRARGYENGSKLYKEYNKDSLPSNEVLKEDLNKMLIIYQAYVQEVTTSNHADNQWLPSLEEYDPKITVEQWEELWNDDTVFEEKYKLLIKQMLAMGGQASCSQLAEKFLGDANQFRSYNTKFMLLGQRIYKKTQCPLFINANGEGKNFWSIVCFYRLVDKNVDEGVKGQYIFKLRDELKEALTNLEITGEDILSGDSTRAWLLTWNPNNWNWEERNEAILMTHNSSRYSIRWSCVNTNVKINDRVFLIRLGCNENNGIIAAGYAASESIEDLHWDPVKAEEGKKIKYVNIDLDWVIDDENEPYIKQSELKELFPQQAWSPQASGIEIREQYVDELEELWKKTIGHGGLEMSTKEKIDKIKNYIASKGFKYEDGIIENFYLSLKSKPFVLLAGTSGTGKTRLVKLFAEAVGAVKNGRYKMVPVRPDWSDSSDLLGHMDLNGNFVPGAIYDFVRKAMVDKKNPYFLCLDEMNLARVEYYFSDFLSVIETRDMDSEANITTEVLYTNKELEEKGEELYLPENLYVIGTVNMDETTFPFSRKVLDRANTIEFSYVDLAVDNIEVVEQTKALDLKNDFLKSEYLLLANCKDDFAYVKEKIEDLQRINEILQKADAHIGYRVRDEFMFYLLNNQKAGLISEDEAFDNELMQKILPRIQGSSVIVKGMLCRLFELCFDGAMAIQTESDNTFDQMYNQCNNDNCRYKHSAKKIAFMVRRFEEDGFTSYWL